jgi:15-cis-phytoene synthase
MITNALTARATAANGRARAQGLAECWDILRIHGKTFHVMAKLLGPERGDAIAALYAFARVADDLVDERTADARPAEVRAELHWMLSELRRAVDGEPVEPRWLVLGEAVRRYAIPLEPFDDLVRGLEMDLDGSTYRTFSDLELYCYRVAGTIGLMITPVAGYREGTRALEYAKTLGSAMQLTNILRDVGEDHARGIVYLPDEDLARFGFSREDLPRHAGEDGFHALVEFEIARARRLYAEGLGLIPLMTSARGRAAFQFAADAYGAILDKIRANEHDVITRRASLSLAEKLAMIPVSAWHAWRAGTVRPDDAPAGAGRAS